MRPHPNDYPKFYHNYIKSVEGDDLNELLEASKITAAHFLNSIKEEKANYRYEPSKWSVKEVINHIIDTERIMSYRALRFARNDETPLAGFEQDDYAENSYAELRSLDDLVDEYLKVRDASISLFRSIDMEAITRSGEANGAPVSVLALGFIILGHEKHHFNVLKEKYQV